MSINERIKKKKKGFTLIELIIVIAIIAILAAIAIPNFLSIQRKARVNADIATGKNLYDATAVMVTDKRIHMPTGVGEDTGFSINFSPSDQNATNLDNVKAIREYLQTDPVPESVKEGDFSIEVSFPEENGKLNLDKPMISVSIIKDNVTKGEVYPKQTGAFAK